MRKTKVSKVIDNKINDWISSITDIELARDIKDSIIVTGGCIVSLINNETPNDFDIYFRNKDITKRVAQYYCNIFNDNNQNRKNKLGKVLHAWVLDGKDVEEYKANNKNLTSFAYGYYNDDDIPSGMITNTTTDRIKVIVNSDGIASSNSELGTEVYMNTIKESDEISSREIDKLNDTEKRYMPVFLSTNAITLSDKIQLVIRFYGSPTQIHETFDYVHCMCYWTSWNKKVHYTVDALDAILNKELKYVGSKYPICSVMRMRKFINRGWKINAGQILKMAFQISELNLHDINVLEDQLVGVDSLYFLHTIECLRKMMEEKKSKGEDFSYDSTYLSTVIDRVFN